MIEPPRSIGELLARAELLAGSTVAELATKLARPVPGRGAGHKGKVGTLVELALGASAGSAATPDFPHLGVELKTIPIDERGTPHESTFVCTVSLADADRATWETSVAQAKLAHVLFVPVIGDPALPARERRFSRPTLWRPTAEQAALLRADFDEIMGRIGAGGIEAITARLGLCMQLRPKAATGRERTMSFGLDGEWIATVPRGFYLRARFTKDLLAKP